MQFERCVVPLLKNLAQGEADREIGLKNTQTQTKIVGKQTIYVLDDAAVIWVWPGGSEKMKSCFILSFHRWVCAVTGLGRANPSLHEA